MNLPNLTNLSVVEIMAYLGSGGGLLALARWLWKVVGESITLSSKTAKQLNSSLSHRVDQVTERLDHVQEENQEWRRRYYDLKEMNQQIKHTNQLLRDRNEKLENQNSYLERQVKQRDQEIALLNRHIRYLEAFIQSKSIQIPGEEHLKENFDVGLDNPK